MSSGIIAIDSDADMLFPFVLCSAVCAFVYNYQKLRKMLLLKGNMWHLKTCENQWVFE